MLRWNKHTRTLEQEEHHFELQDIAEPNLFRDTFPYVEVPRIPFVYLCAARRHSF